MNMMEFIGQGILNVFTIDTIFWILLGTFVGIVFGAVPGLTGTLGILLFLPLTRNMDIVNAVVYLSAIFCGGEFGGSISAILIGTPGTNSAVCTMLEGYPLAKRGQAQRALTMALLSSTFGGILSALTLLFLAPVLARYTLKFGPPEYFAIAVFGLSIIASVSGKSLSKGIFAGCLGVVLSIVGMDSVSGLMRLTFKNINLYNGIELVAILTGLFALSSLIEKVEQIFRQRWGRIEKQEEVVLDKSSRLSLREFFSHWWILIKSSVIGIIIGIIPGIGTGVASFVSYDTAKKGSKHPEEYGKGSLEGIAAVEASNNGVTAASLIPLLTLGLPGSPSAAVLIGAFTMQGLAAGPMLFREHTVIIYTIMVGIVLANVAMLMEGKILTPLFSKITKIPNDVMVPILMVICAAGAVSCKNSGFDLMIFIAAGITGYVLQTLKVPIVPIVIGFVLGQTMDSNLRKGLVMTSGDFVAFATRPITFVVLVITVLVLVMGFVKEAKNKTKKENILDND